MANADTDMNIEQGGLGDFDFFAGLLPVDVLGLGPLGPGDDLAAVALQRFFRHTHRQLVVQVARTKLPVLAAFNLAVCVLLTCML